MVAPSVVAAAPPVCAHLAPRRATEVRMAGNGLWMTLGTHVMPGDLHGATRMQIHQYTSLNMRRALAGGVTGGTSELIKIIIDWDLSYLITLY